MNKKIGFDKHKQIFEMKQEGVTHREIAKTLSIGVGTVSDQYKKILELVEEGQYDIVNGALHDVRVTTEDEKKTFGVVEIKDNTYNYTYHPKTDMYIGKVNNEMVMMSRDVVLSIFQEYAKLKKIGGYSALGKSRQEIMFDYDLGPNEWSFLQNNLFLRTTGPNADPVTIMNHEKNGTLEQFEEEQAKHQLRNKYQYRVQKKQQQIFERDARKALDVINNFEARKKYVYEKGDFDFEYSSLQDIEDFKKGDVGMYNISDLHTGGWDLEETKKLLRSIAQDIIESGYKKVILNINGDMFEAAILGGYHRGQIEDMAIHQGTDSPIFGDKLLVFTAMIIENCLLRPVHAAGIKILAHCRGGNHGRGAVESKDDPYGLLELMMYYSIQQSLKDTDILFEYASNLQPVYYLENFLGFKKVAIALSHGHIRSHSQKRKSIASKYLHTADYVFVIQSHFHNGKIKQESQIKEKSMTETGDRCMLIVTPALCPANTYAREQVIADSPRGFVKIENNRYNRFKVLFEYVG